MSAAGYVAPATLDQAAQFLQHPGALPLAGGHRLLLLANRAKIAGAILVDLGKVKDLAGLTLQPDGSLQVGPMTTLDALLQDEVVKAQYPMLAEATGWMGDAQLRNRATVGGTLADGDPESDLPALLLALGATVKIRNGTETRVVPMEEFFVAGRTALTDHDLITAIHLPALPGAMMSYERIKHPATLEAVCGVAVCCVSSESGEISAIRVGVTGALTTPARLTGVEKALVGVTPDESLIVAAVSAIPGDLPFRSDLFGSGEYRRQLLQVLTRRTLTRALLPSA